MIKPYWHLEIHCRCQVILVNLLLLVLLKLPPKLIIIASPTEKTVRNSYKINSSFKGIDNSLRYSALKGGYLLILLENIWDLFSSLP